jgi:hypothetical protein
MLGTFSPASGQDRENVNYLRIIVESSKQMRDVSALVSIDEATRGDTVYAWATDQQLLELQQSGVAFEQLPLPYSTTRSAMAPSAQDAKAWDMYPTYEAYVSMMIDYALNYSSICVLDTIGTTTNGRQLLMLKISDNPSIEENEPEVLLTSSIHGDEVTGYVLMLRLIDSILTTYGSNSRVDNIVNNVELFINPAANPDGTYYGGNSTVSGAIRYNANFVDLNRNYPDFEDGDHPDGKSWQPETVAFMGFAGDHSISLSVNFHGGAEVVNYPWDTWYQRHADDAWFQLISREYADLVHTVAPPTYMDGFDDGITNGADWYIVNGGRQDYMNYFHGAREITIEISNTKLLDAALLPAHWVYNRESLLSFIEQSRYGIHGTVTDFYSSLPLDATVSILYHDVDSTRVFTDPDVGDYHRLIKAGTYDVVYSADGYYPDTVENVTVTDYGTTTLDVQLLPLPAAPVLVCLSNNAGRSFPGDTVEFDLALRNYGLSTASAVSVQIGTNDPLADIVSSMTTCPDLAAAGGVAWTSTDLVVVINSAAVQGDEIGLEAEISAAGGFIDTLAFTLPVARTFDNFETSDLTAFDWQTAGSQPWSTTAAETPDGLYAVRSGSIFSNQTSELEVTRSSFADDSVSFWLQVSSEYNYDFARFFIDNIEYGSWSGSLPWQRVSFPVDSGSHSYRWTYSKDASSSVGEDVFWIDSVSFPSPDTVFSGSCCVDSTGNVNGDPLDITDISDLTYLVNHLFITFDPIGCPEEANTNGDAEGIVDISDLTALVNNLFVTFAPLAPCQ